MRILLLILLSVNYNLISNAQQTINGSIMHNGIVRNYILYIPSSHTNGTNAPLVLNFHGLSSNSNEQMLYSNMMAIADTAGFIIAHPMGTINPQGQTYWNAGFGGAADDIGFTAALIDSLAANYSIDLDRVYSTGMSNGGFMSYTLACELHSKIAAIASVTGSMITTQLSTCNPGKSIPILQIHGTNDQTVPYSGAGFIASMDAVMNHWAQNNQCNLTANVNMLPNISTTDGSTVEHYTYENQVNNIEVELYKILGGGHTWPGAPVVIGPTNYDINASAIIWQFFNKYDINGRIGSTSTNNINDNGNKISISFANGYLHPKTAIKITSEKRIKSIRIYNLNGKLVSMSNSMLYSAIINIEQFDFGLYVIQVIDEHGTQITEKFMLD